MTMCEGYPYAVSHGQQQTELHSRAFIPCSSPSAHFTQQESHEMDFEYQVIPMNIRYAKTATFPTPWPSYQVLPPLSYSSSAPHYPTPRTPSLSLSSPSQSEPYSTPSPTFSPTSTRARTPMTASDSPHNSRRQAHSALPALDPGAQTLGVTIDTLSKYPRLPSAKQSALEVWFTRGRPPTRKVSRLLQLTPDCWAGIIRYLDIEDFEKLVSLLPGFMRDRLFAYLPWYEKKTYLRGQELANRHPAESSGCSLCFRMKRRDQFPMTWKKEKANPRDTALTFSHARVKSIDPQTGFRTFERLRGITSARVIPPVPKPELRYRPNDMELVHRMLQAKLGQRDTADPGPSVLVNFHDDLVPTDPAHYREWVERRLGPGRIGEIVQLGLYCIQCALSSGLLRSRDMFMTSMQQNTDQTKQWVCDCLRPHEYPTVSECQRCGVREVYRSYLGDT